MTTFSVLKKKIFSDSIQTDYGKDFFLNTSWLFGEKIFRMLLNFFVMAWTVRYLGPENFGIISYILAFQAFFEPLAHLGLPSIIKKTFIVQNTNHQTLKKHDEQQHDLQTIWNLLSYAGIFSFLILNLISFFIHKNNVHMFLMILLSSFIFFLKPIEMIEHLFDAQMKSRPIVVAKLFGMIFSSLLKIIGIFLESGLYYFLAVFVFEFLFICFCYIYVSKKLIFPQQQVINFFSLKNFHLQKFISLLKISSPLIFSSFTIVIYMKIDQLMLHHYLGPASVGLYAAAVKLSELWYFIPMSLSVSFFPVIMKAFQSSEKEFISQMQKIFTIMTWIFILLGGPLFLCSKLLITFIFQKDYLAAVPIFHIHLWTGLFVFWGVVLGPWEVATSQLKFSSFRTLAGAVTNIISNIVLIPRHGALGAAISTVLAQFVTNCFMNLFNQKHRQIFMMQIKSLDIRILAK